MGFFETHFPWGPNGPSRPVSRPSLGFLGGACPVQEKSVQEKSVQEKSVQEKSVTQGEALAVHTYMLNLALQTPTLQTYV